MLAIQGSTVFEKHAFFLHHPVFSGQKDTVIVSSLSTWVFTCQCHPPMLNTVICLILTAIGLTPGGSSSSHTNCTQNTENGKYIIEISKRKLGSAGRAPSLRVYTLAFGLQRGKITENPQGRIVKKCSDIPVAVVQYTFAHKQYTEQHNGTEYTERNINNDKST
jgi:hypothetical protein